MPFDCRSLDKTLAFGVVGNGGIMSGKGRVNDRRRDCRVAARGGAGKIPKPQGIEIEKDLVRRGPDGLKLELLFHFLLHKVKVSLEHLRPFFA